MPLETAEYLHQLEASNPASTDQLSQADDHIRLIKQVLLDTFPNLTGPVTATEDSLNATAFSVPIGAVWLWYGSSGSVPSGWALCNGQTVSRSDDAGTIVTPNLVDKTVIGAGNLYTQGTSYGALTATDTSTSSGAHTHTVNGGSHTHALDGTVTVNSASLTPTLTKDGGAYDRSGGSGDPLISVSIPSHTHTASLSGSVTADGGHTHTVSSDGAHTHDVEVSTLQPSLALHYIMKV